MTPASERGKPKGRPTKKTAPGPKPERLAIPPEKAEDALDRLLGKKPAPKKGGGSGRVKPSE